MNRIRLIIIVMLFSAIAGASMLADGKVLANEAVGQMIYAEDSVIAVMEKGVTDSQMEEVVDETGAEISEELKTEENIVLLEVPEGETVEEITEKLEKQPEIKSVQPNYLYFPDEVKSQNGIFISNDPLSEMQWNLDYIDAKEAWDLIDQLKPLDERTEEDRIKVATIDTGIYTSNQDMDQNIDWEHTVSILGESPYVPSEMPIAAHGMGTSGMIAATSNNDFGMAGVAAGNHNDLIELMAINVFHMDTYTDNACATTADVIKGLEYACENGARVIVLCFGHTTGATDHMGVPHDDAALEAAINTAVYEHDVVICCTAGNQGDSRIWNPGDFEACISVMNTKQYTNAWKKSAKNSSSSYGSSKDISAPGTKVYLPYANDTFKTSTGTSFATPTVAAVAAMVRYIAPELTVEDVKNILYSTAEDLYVEGYDIYTGHGNVNAYRAVAAAAGQDIQVEREILPAVRNVKAKSAGTATIQVTWNEVKDAQGYQIFRSTEKNGEYELVGQVNEDDTSFKHGKRRFNRSYYYKVRAIGTSEDGKKIYSELTEAVAGKAVTAIPSVKLSNVNYKTIKVSWNKVNKSSGYIIYRATSENGIYKKVKTINKGTISSWKDSNCTGGKSYYYKIKSFRDVNGTKGYTDDSNVVKLKAKPAKPVLSVKKSKNKAKITWSKSKYVTGYQLYRAYSKDGKWKKVKTFKTTSRYNTKTLKKDRRVYFKMRTYKKVNGKLVYSDYSTIKSVKR